MCCSHKPEPFALLFIHECLDGVEIHTSLCSNFVCITFFSTYFPQLLSLNFMVLHQEVEESKDKAGLDRGLPEALY